MGTVLNPRMLMTNVLVRGDDGVYYIKYITKVPLIYNYGIKKKIKELEVAGKVDPQGCSVARYTQNSSRE